MKRKYFLLIFIVLAAAYLYFSHFSIYYRIKKSNLKATDNQHTYIMINPSTEKETIYAALGDSLTSGVGTESIEQAYPNLLAKKLSQALDSSIILKNFSYPGARTEHLIKDLLDPAIADNPDIITLLIGTNDVHGLVGKDEFKQNYSYILERLSKETKAKIYVISIPYIGSDDLLMPPYDLFFAKQVTAYNQVIKSLAATHGAKYIDLATPTQQLFKKSGTHYAKDLFHPSPEGYKLWSDLIYADIDR